MATTRTRTIFEFMLLRMLSSSLEMVSIAGMHFVRQVRLSPHLALKDPTTYTSGCGQYNGLSKRCPLLPQWQLLAGYAWFHAQWRHSPGRLIALGLLQRSRAICLGMLCGAA